MNEATGIVTALKSGNSLQVVIPKQIREFLSIQPRDRLKIVVSKDLDESGKPKTRAPRRHDLKKNLVMKE